MKPTSTDRSAETPLTGGSVTSQPPLCDPVLDLALLRRRCLGNDELVGQILSKLRSTVTDELERLRVACVEHDFSMAARLAHRLKGTAANVEAAGLRQAAERLEAAARLGDAAGLAAAWPPLEEQGRRLGRTAAGYQDA